jgi:cytochrome c-type biogenesis protein CcmE
MNKRLVIGGIIIGVCIIAALTAFEDSLTAYVDFDKARTLDKNCQVYGEIVKDEAVYDADAGILRFPITDEHGDRLLVHFAGAVPGNFEQAKSVVAIGRYAQGHFQAERLLVKCPSKYQGLEQEGETNPHEAEMHTGQDSL